jgi:hypothetical protein
MIFFCFLKFQIWLIWCSCREKGRDPIKAVPAALVFIQMKGNDNGTRELEAVSSLLLQSFQCLEQKDLFAFNQKILELQQSTKELEVLMEKHQKLDALRAEYSQTLYQTRFLEQTYQEALENSSLLMQKTSLPQSLLTAPMKMNLEDFVTLAQNVSLTAKAPANYQPAMPLEPFKPPVPTEDQMRRSVLYQAQTAPEGEQKQASSLAELNELLEKEAKRVQKEDCMQIESDLLNVDL